MDDPLFSLALPLLNGMPGLKRMVATLERQSYRNFELIVVDGGSADGGPDYLAGTDLPGKHIVAETASGETQAFNRAVRHCQGTLIVPIAATTWLEPDGLDAFARWHRENPNAAVYNGSVRPWYGEAESGPVREADHFELVRLMRGEMFPTAARVFNLDIIGDELRLDEKLATHADFEMFIRFGLRFTQAEFFRGKAVVLNVMEGDASERAETIEAGVRARHRILDRFFAGEVASPLMRHMRNACISSIYARAAT
jgi:glycosyltransferase involved in cell wall biosynthesis